ncbi:hypothetical protein [Cedratvirus kamchatka]|uniref:Uncharacterized protein n=1 Tax=Cedratvirus kamchatka TaxID=2716914 RepID=A0A6G8MXH7_9VIRU|nr:hypothetical protein [Cedratvirus kamchatka]WIL04109.1 hypothetical protein Clen_179 [Cedratvirus lena]WIL04720.1 hypothetical protein Cduv_240 [Cedratvirus duvanny]
MSFKVLLAVPISYEEEEKGYLEVKCAFVDQEQYEFMADDNFDAIYDRLCALVKKKKGEGWEPDLGDPIEPVRSLKDDSLVDIIVHL